MHSMNQLEFGRIDKGAEYSIGFFLTESFNMLPFISALETLRIANRLSKKPLYQWRVVTADGLAVRASNGMVQQADHSISDLVIDSEDFSMLVVSGPFFPNDFNDQAVLDWLVQQGEKNMIIAGLETGSHILAKAGVAAWAAMHHSLGEYRRVQGGLARTQSKCGCL